MLEFQTTRTMAETPDPNADPHHRNRHHRPPVSPSDPA